MLDNVLLLVVIWLLNCHFAAIVILTAINVYIMWQNNGGTFKKNKKGG